MVCCLVLLLKTRDPFGAGVALWWFGESFLDLAPYIDDAGTGELPLLGGNTGESTPYGFHDWEYLMTETGRLGHEHELARASQVLGPLIMIVALAWMAFTLFRVWRLDARRRRRKPFGARRSREPRREGAESRRTGRPITVRHDRRAHQRRPRNSARDR